MTIKHRLRIVLSCAAFLVIAGCGTRSPDDLLAEARSAWSAGEARTAEIHLRNLVEQDPENAEGRLLLAQVLQARGDAPGAEVHFRRALAFGVESAPVYPALMRALLLQGKFADVLAQHDADPGPEGEVRVEILRMVGAAHRGLGARAEAEAAYRAALGIDPRSMVVRSDLAALMVEAGRRDEAAQLVADLIGEDPAFVPALLLRARLESAAREYRTARATLQDAVSVAEASGGGMYAAALVRLVEVQIAMGDTVPATENLETLLEINPRDPTTRFLSAVLDAQQGNFAEAESTLEAVLSTFPEYWPAHRVLGGINANQGRLSQAEMYLRSAVNNDSTDTAARLMLAEVYIRLGDIEQARRLLGEAADGDGLLLAAAGRASLQAGDLEFATELFDQSEQRTPQSTPELLNLSSVYVAAGEFERALRVLESATDQGEANQAITSFLLTLVELKRGDFDAARAAADALSAPGLVWPLNVRGAVELLAGQPGQARELYEQALELEPDNVGVLLNLARADFALGDEERVTSALLRVVEVEPGHTAALAGLARLALGRGDVQASRGWLDRVPDSALKFRLIGELEIGQGRYERAAAEFARAHGLAPSGDLAVRIYDARRRAGHGEPDAILLEWIAEQPDDAIVNAALAGLAMERGDINDAAERYEAALRGNPRDLVALNNLAWIYSESGDARAMDLAMRAYDVDPTNLAVADTLGWLYVRQGEAATGWPLLERASEGRPDDAEIRYHYAVALAETGRDDRALAVLSELVEGDASFSGREDAEERLRDLRNRD